MHTRHAISILLLLTACNDYQLGTFDNPPTGEADDPAPTGSDEGPCTLLDWFMDADGDGYGRDDAIVSSCEQPTNTASEGGDCDDEDETIHPGAEDLCGDGIDSDCDGFGGPDDDEDGDGYSYTQEQALGTDDCDPEDPGEGVGWDNVGHLAPLDDVWDAAFPGIDIGDYSGEAVDVGGDVNGDGFADMIIGSEDHGETGAAWLIWGSDQHTGTTLLSDPGIVTFLGEEPGDDAGRSVAIGGDLNGDGYADIVIGAPDHNGEGVAYLVYGGPHLSGEISLGDPSVVRFEGVAYSATGSAVDLGGDVNGDGLDDLLIGAKSDPLTHRQGGAAYLVLGGPDLAGAYGLLARANAAFGAEGEYDELGVSVDIGGDVDGDGLDDMLIGASHESSFATAAGAAYLVTGRAVWAGTTTLSELTAIKYTGHDVNGEAGEAVAIGGDVNGDGYADLAIGAPSFSGPGPGAGAVYLVHGASQLSSLSLADPSAWLFEGESNYDGVGNAVDLSGDLSGDGFADLVIGARSEDHFGFNSGSIYVLLDARNRTTGASLSDPEVFKFYGTESLGHAGSDVATGDVNADGIADLLVGADGSALNGAASGTTYLMWGHP